MEFFDAKQIEENLDWHDCVEALREMFAKGCEAPVRHHHTMEVPGHQEATMLLMPAWLPGKYAGLKLVNVYPDNPQKGLPTIMGNYLLMDGGSGTPIASMDGGELTARRTAAASALASDYLSRKDADKLLIVGSGRLANYLGYAHGAVRELKKIRIWARDESKAQTVAVKYKEAGLDAEPANNLEEAVGWADIVSCATMSAAPLILGKWLRAGVHLDLIGSFKPTMRETDDEAVSRAEVFVDTREGALAEAGDLLIAMQNGTFSQDDIRAELSELADGGHPGRTDEEEITLFKSVGASLEDLAAAIRCFENWQKRKE
ncbi:MAG: ornithine cyclodeaminase family protein [Desulfocapsaceae bacterium]|nr:ornithine cyclodeaminase family protein [Desulfocapsaceae bacterium]